METRNAKDSAETSPAVPAPCGRDGRLPWRQAMRGAPAGFAEFHASDTTRTPGQILAHLGDLLDWALSQSVGKRSGATRNRIAWDDGAKRFFASLKALDDYIGSDAALSCTPEKLFQGALADMLTHIGQISMLRRLAGSRVRGGKLFSAPKSLWDALVPSKLRLRGNSIDRKAVR